MVRVPAAIGHAPCAAPLLDYLVGHFDDVRIVAVRTKLFPELSEDCWLLHAGGFGGMPPRWDSGAGPPFTLVCTKTRATHERRLAEYAEDASNMRALAESAPGAKQAGRCAVDLEGPREAIAASGGG